MLEQTLIQTVLLLGVTITILVIFRRLHVPAVLGYLVVGILLSSKTAGPTIEDDYIVVLAQFGIVFLLFSIGLSFSLAQIYAMRHTVLGLGSAQVVLTTLVVALFAWWLGLPAVAAFVVGAVFAQSSTTIISKQLLDQGEGSTRHGRLATAMSVFQDITAVPFVVIIPVLGVAATHQIAEALGVALLLALLALLGVVLIGRFLLRPLFHLISEGGSAELFTLAVLFVSLLAAWATDSLGLSMAFGAFLAGMVLGETEFRHQVEATIRPFRDVLLGLFFISIGMLVDPTRLPDIWREALLGAVGLLLVKALIVFVIVRMSGTDVRSALRTGLVLAVGGEFGFALLALGLQAGVIADLPAQIVLNAVFFSMILSAALIRYNQPIADVILRVLPGIGPGQEAPPPSVEVVAADHHVVICGYGRIGQVVGRFLESENISYVAMDMDSAIVKEARLAGQPVYFGDSSDASVLETVGAADAELMIISHGDMTATLKTLRHARRLNPDLPIVVRTRDESHVGDLRREGATEVIPETLEAGLMIVSHALMVMRVPTHRIAQRLQEHRASRYQLLRELFRGDLTRAQPLRGGGLEQLHSVVLGEGAPAVGKTLEDIDTEARHVTVTTLVREGRRERSPHRSTRLETGDVLVLLGSPDDLDKMEIRLTGFRSPDA